MNYTYEEKKVIEKIYIIIKKCELKFKTIGYECDLYDEDEPIPVNEYKTLLNLIEKQQKEIENLNKKYIQEKVAKEEVEELLENSVPKEAIRNISNHIEYYLLGNLRYKDSQEQFEYLLKNLKEILGE